MGFMKVKFCCYVMCIVYYAWYNDLGKKLCTENNLLKQKTFQI